jgi:hypothetical protein
MANNFTKQELVMFDELVDGFDDALVIAKQATKYTPDSPEAMQRGRDQFWIPAPMIGATFSGVDQSANFGDITQTQVPVQIGYFESANAKVGPFDARNESALRQWIDAAKQKLASRINYTLYQTVALQGSITVKRTVSPTGYDDVALADAAMTEIGASMLDRKMALAPRVANAMAGNLASRNEATKRSSDAYERAMINSDVAGFEVFKNDQTILLAAATGGTTTVNGANQRYVPKATVLDNLGVEQNVDNRYSDLVVTAVSYANIKPGDAFTIAGVNSVHMISKEDTGQLQTFRVISKPAANTIRIAPALISADSSPTKPETEYKNVTATPANGAAITWLNTTAAALNPFFVKGSLLLIPGSYVVNGSDGWNVTQATTPLGIALTMVAQGEINDLSRKLRIDARWGTALTNPQLAGVELFNQA